MHEIDMEQVIKDSMVQYSGAVLQSRALVDVRDCLKPSARQIFYCLYTDKFTADKPFKKTLKAVGSAARMYIHGDSSIVGIIMRAGQPFSMRYPLIEVEGSEGNLTESGNWASPRYNASRLSGISSYLFQDIGKNTIEEWHDNYDDTEKYPSVLPTKGYYNIVNGAMGIGIGLASSIPQYNLREVNNALIQLLLNPQIPDDDIICMPDFATGAILLNGEEVREAMKCGQGSACKLRSVINWDEDERCLVVTEIPYGVYTNTICGELEAILLDEKNAGLGIERFNDLTGVEPLLKIYLTKKADPKKVISFLYKNTSLQYYYGVNFTMLDKGRYPKIFTWRQALQAHIDHEKIVYRKGFEYDLAKIQHRIHIIDGLLVCVANIDEVVGIIKNSASAAQASFNLQQKFLLDEEQAKAVLAIKLSSLAKLEVNKLQAEKISLTEEANKLIIILENEKEFNQQLINGWNEVSRKFGDNRRTVVYDNYQDEQPPKEIKNITISITAKDKYVVKDGSNKKLKVYKKEKVKYNMSGTTENIFYLFSNMGKCYRASFEDFNSVSEGTVAEKVGYAPNEHTIGVYEPFMQNKYAYLVTKSGMLVKMEVEEITKIKKNKAIIGLNEYDELVSVLFDNGDGDIVIGTKKGLATSFDLEDIRPLKGGAKGVAAMKVDIDDGVSCAALTYPLTTHLVTLTSKPNMKRTPIAEFPLQGRGGKGRIAHKLDENEELVEIISITADDEFCHSENFGEICVEDIPETKRNSKGSKIF